YFVFFFFFSSRRRHTRCLSDWSSDVCSSDLTLTPSSLHYERHHSGIPTIDPGRHRLVIHGMVETPLSLSVADIHRLPSVSRTMEIGRASCREKGEVGVVAVDLEGKGMKCTEM